MFSYFRIPVVSSVLSSLVLFCTLRCIIRCVIRFLKKKKKMMKKPRPPIHGAILLRVSLLTPSRYLSQNLWGFSTYAIANCVVSSRFFYRGPSHHIFAETHADNRNVSRFKSAHLSTSRRFSEVSKARLFRP